MPEWTAQQRAVIDSPSGKIICSAAAGSGKTAVMVERVIRMLREGKKPENFLVVTFTNAAALEMKQKIRDRLRAERRDRNLRAALEQIDLMEISTIHAFCQHLIRQEFQAAEVDPFFSVCDGARSKKLFEEAFRSACASLQRESHPDYLYWKKCFSHKETGDIIRSVHSFMMSLPDPFAWLDRSCDRVPVKIDPDHPWFAAASCIVKEKLKTAQVILRRQFLMFGEEPHGEPYRAVWKSDSELFHVKQCLAEGKAPEEGAPDGFVRLPAWSRLNSLEADWKERYQALREQLKDLMKEIDPLIDPDPETVERDFGSLRSALQGLKVITRRTSEKFAERKKKLRLLDFNDLEHCALKILRTEPAGTAVRRRYPEVFVDECQDVSQVQDEMIQRLSSGEGHLFMVGDVKQSIYRFRLAEPTLFLNRTREYGRPESEGTLLELQTNFRSRPEILETANTVFRDIMRQETAEMDYTEREELIPGRPAEGLCPVLVDVLEPDPERTKLEITADDVTERIRELEAEGFQYRDMVILMPRVSGDGPKLAELLEQRGIPVFFDGGGDFYEREEIAAFVQLLSHIDNPVPDEPLISVLKNAPFFFTEEELARVRLKNPGKDVPFRRAFEDCLASEGELGDRCREAAEKIRSWRKLSSVLGMGTFVRTLCSDAHRMAVAGLRSAGNTAQQNLRIFCRKAEEAEKQGIYTLSRFLSYVSEQAGGGDQREASPLAEGDQVVRLMTMHKSKGLQFPVVFCLGLDGKLSHRADASVMTDAELGICLNYKRPEFRISRPTAATAIFSWKKNREQRSERIRLLYVAMTRAQQRMILAGVGEDQVLWQMPAGEHRVLSAGNYLDWILPALMDASKQSTTYAQGSTPWKIRVSAVNQQKIVDKSPSYPQFRSWLDSLLSAPPVEDLWKEGKKEPVLSAMQKKSVTSLLRSAEQVPEEEEEETAESKRIPDRFSRALRRSELKKAPAFMQPPPEKRGAWRGTLVHRFLSLADLDRIRRSGEDPVPALQAMKEEMLSSGVFTPEEGAVIRPEDAAAYFRSPLGLRMLESPEVRREWDFNLYRPEMNLLVQGVVDCAFREKEGWVLVDYKTDHVENVSELVETYRLQLQWYAQAIGTLTGQPVKEAWLYSISRRESCPVPLENP